MRFVGHKNGRIHSIFTKKMDGTIQVPSDLDHLSEADLILNSKVINEQIVLNRSKLAKDMKIALIGNYKQRCGISTYAESLWSHVTPMVGDIRIFAEEVVNPVSKPLKLGNIDLKSEQVIFCWNRGQSLIKLVQAVKEYQPDIIWIQHEFGLWSNASHWLSMLTQLSEYRIVVTMHSTFYHQDKTIVEAAIPEMVVHLEGAKEVLLNIKQIKRPIHVIPHGANVPDLSQKKLWNFYKSPYTIVQFGFLFKYKGWETALRSVALLKEKYPNVFFTGLCSENEFGKVEHQVYYQQLKDLIEELKIEENVSLIRGFQSDQVIDSYLRTNQVALFPYISAPGHEVFGASGAARLAMEKQIPVVSSSIPHFSDLPTIKANSEVEIANSIDLLFQDWKLKKKQIELQNEYLKTISWDIIAKKYISIFENPLDK